MRHDIAIDVGNPFVLFSHFYMKCILVSVLFIALSSILVSVLFIGPSSLLLLDFLKTYLLLVHNRVCDEFGLHCNFCL